MKMKLDNPKAVAKCDMCKRETLLSKLFYGAVCFGCESKRTDPNRIKIYNESNL